ncbi:MAG: aminoacyl-tRNA hydrolase [Oscillospiraceae bacterium]|jgi:PTH1 family peptidyl-tRNA hydrolase|nr:aminoacyl-tRNA hydrolase [Oscillospiraceae bacterium]
MTDCLIAGLGNPGKVYENTRHNAGFWVLDELAQRRGVKIKKIKFHGTYAQTDSLLLLKPQTFMNRSGQAVRDAAAFYQIPPERIIVVYDEAALPPGRLRLRASGSDGGHNGLKDILYHLQTDRFPRVRIGVGGPPHPDTDLADWVLAPIASADRTLFADAVRRAADAVECIVREGIETAMNQYNQLPPAVEAEEER